MKNSDSQMLKKVHSILLLLVSISFLLILNEIGEHSRWRKSLIKNKSPEIYPWIALIQAKSRGVLNLLIGLGIHQFCVAVMIKPEWLLTAANCLYIATEATPMINYTKPEKWQVRIGVRTLDPTLKERIKGFFIHIGNLLFGYTKPKPLYYVDKIIQHPKFEYGSSNYDLALFKLKEVALLKKLNYSKLIGLPETSVKENWPENNQTCLTFGWGCNFQTEMITTKLKVVNLSIIFPAKCNDLYAGYLNLLSEKQFCAEYASQESDVCMDYASPFICRDISGNFKLIGIINNLNILYPIEQPIIFNRISNYINWIQETIENN